MKLYDLGGVAAAFLFFVIFGNNMDYQKQQDEHNKQYKAVLLHNKEIRTDNDVLILRNKDLATLIEEFKAKEEMDNTRKVILAPGFEIGVSKKGFEDDDDKKRRLTREGLPTEYPEKKQPKVEAADGMEIKLIPKEK